MDNDLLVSVIIPVYNVYPYLVEALESVISQTYDNLEIIIVDDGSTDGSGQICDEYAGRDKRIRVIHQDNKGLSEARNIGLDISSGEIISFLDPDDKYLPNYVLIMLSELKRQNADIVICRNTVHHTTNEMRLDGTEKAEPSIAPGLYSRTEALQARADGSINPNVWNKLYKSYLWKEIRFPTGHVYEDIAVIFKILNLCKTVYVIDEVLYLRRIRLGSITSTPSLKTKDDCIWALSQFEAFIIENCPGLFYEKHLIQIRMTKLHLMLALYSSYIQMSDEEVNEKKTELRNQIIKGGAILKSAHRLPFQSRIAYELIRYSPWLFKLAYKIHRRIT